jgi:hypothetical protein
MKDKEILCGILFLVAIYLLVAKPAVESFELGQQTRKRVEHGSLPQFYR